ncbi:MAG: GTPase RsgA [Olsenella sp.]|jgi:ribosome biogenesis GTPase
MSRRSRHAQGHASGRSGGAPRGAAAAGAGRGARGGRGQGRAADKGAGGAAQALPALSSLSDVPPFDKLSMSEAQREAYARDVAALEAEGIDVREVEPACVVRLDRSFPAVVAASGIVRAEFSFRFGVVREPSAAVGDWVCLRRPHDHDMAVIEFVLPRESDIARWRGGSRGKRQTLAANVDVVLVAQALGRRELDLDRIVRSAVIAEDCHARAAVVLTKADRAGAELLGRDLELVRRTLGEDCPLAVTAAGAGAGGAGAARRDAGADVGALAEVCRRERVRWGVEGVCGLVPRGTVAIVLGESGAGKSTLLNALLGHEALEVGRVRERDDAGRHTTVARRMVDLPGAGVIVDEPGLRSLPLVGHERGLARVFPDVAEAASLCRFRDCTHTIEPGCEVLARVRAGEIPRERADAYVALAQEMRRSAGTLDPDITL